VVIDSRCTFCVKSRAANPGRETFRHIFYDCPQLTRVLRDFAAVFFRPENDPVKARLSSLTGLLDNAVGCDNFFYVLTSVFLNYTLWQWKLKKIIPSPATLFLEVDNHFYAVTLVSKKITEMASNSNTGICRRWREQHHRRG
jgi:hypothetical protein